MNLQTKPVLGLLALSLPQSRTKKEGAHLKNIQERTLVPYNKCKGNYFSDIKMGRLRIIIVGRNCAIVLIYNILTINWLWVAIIV